MGKTITPLFILALSLIIISCNFNKGIKQSNDTIAVIKAIKTPIVGGALKARGIRIGLQITHKRSQITADSITYQGFSQPITKIAESGDTIWVESYFYPNQKITITNDNKPIKYTSNSCTVHYHIHRSHKVNSSLLIKNLKLVQDPTLWE
jgi:hypothetical protein